VGLLDDGIGVAFERRKKKQEWKCEILWLTERAEVDVEKATLHYRACHWGQICNHSREDGYFVQSQSVYTEVCSFITCDTLDYVWDT
jgi:hypothetical protein